MALDDLKDRLKEQSAEVWSRIEGSPLYSNLKEKFETQTPTTQKSIIAGGILLLSLLFLSYPLSDFGVSSTNVEDYEKNRSQLRSLLRASRLASEAASAPAAYTANDLKNQVQAQLGSFALKPEQMGEVLDLDLTSMGTPLAPKSIVQNGVGINLKKLNLKQVVDIGFELQKLNPSVKIAGMEVTAGSPDPHYFDVLYKLIVFSMPQSSNNDSGAEK